MDLYRPELYRIVAAAPYAIDPSLPRIELCVPSPDLCRLVADAFLTHPAFSVSCMSLTETTAPVIVVPGDSFGLFTYGGVDRVVADFLDAAAAAADSAAGTLKEHVAALLRHDRWAGELPVGQALYVPPIGDATRSRGVIYAPVARVPDDVSDTVNAYLAFRAALIVARERCLPFVAAPLFATGAGGMDPAVACRQMREAYETLARSTFADPAFDWAAAWSHHCRLLPGDGEKMT